ncbi:MULTISPECIES: YggT family protein [Clostridium]|uniref:YggT family protein n=1 Tax=Clostridium cibarium TaxID=2762247 RepID=A0ABR8PPF6_9CLOT|nr:MULTISPECIES: YggT family protein [Clostridium]MBD7910055.1 YggT family protein [Clostridium cibarium]
MEIIIKILLTFIRFYELIIFIECILSWIIQDSRNEIMNLLRTITNPILEPFRRLQYKYFGNVGIDVSPIFALILLQMISRFLITIF